MLGLSICPCHLGHASCLVLCPRHLGREICLAHLGREICPLNLDREICLAHLGRETFRARVPFLLTLRQLLCRRAPLFWRLLRALRWNLLSQQQQQQQQHCRRDWESD